MKRSIVLLIAAIIGLAYSIYIIGYFGSLNSGNEYGSLASGIATAMVLPHMICLIIAVVFNIIGWVINKRGFALTAGILYSVSAVLFIMYAIFVIPSIVLSFVGFVRLKKIIEQNKIKQTVKEESTS